MIDLLAALGTTDDVVGPWRITDLKRALYEVSASTRSIYPSEHVALEAARLLVPRLVPNSYIIENQPDLSAVVETTDKNWLAHVRLELRPRAA